MCLKKQLLKLKRLLERIRMLQINKQSKQLKLLQRKVLQNLQVTKPKKLLRESLKVLLRKLVSRQLRKLKTNLINTYIPRIRSLALVKLMRVIKNYQYLLKLERRISKRLSTHQIRSKKLLRESLKVLLRKLVSRQLRKLKTNLINIYLLRRKRLLKNLVKIILKRQTNKRKQLILLNNRKRKKNLKRLLQPAKNLLVRVKLNKGKIIIV